MKREQVERYLCSVLREPVTVTGFTRLGGAPEDAEDKGFGYGIPIRVDYEAADREPHSAVIHTIGAGQFGHEHMSDRAQILLWQHKAFNSLPRHVRALDVAGFGPGGTLTSLGDLGEFCLVTEFAEGQLYARDLHRMLESGVATSLDFDRCDALADYLAGVHRTPVNQPGLYARRVRELVGHGECLMGIADSFPDHPVVTRAVLEGIEHEAVKWRWRLKDRAQRLRAVHGDFHPWNILFQRGADFRLLDRSRGEYGDPADDVTCLAANYLFFSLQRTGRLEGSFLDLFLRFWDRYLEKTGDREILEVAAPWFAFRGLVMASPVWYPNLPESVRQKLIAFILAVLSRDAFDPREVNAYCGA
jgi:hypothetical protein